MGKNDNFRCSFAYPGTYGHECGKPAVFTGVKPSVYTKNRIFYAHRCKQCTKARGIDNFGISQWVALDPDAHVNQF